jgi:hypothetical protein
MMKPLIVAGLMIATLAAGPAQAGSSKLGAVLGGVAVGAVGGAIIGSALSAQARPAPVYVQPDVEYVEPAPRRIVAVQDPFDDQASRLHLRCDDGDRHACIRFGILIGQHREHVAQWRRSHPDYFSYED